MRRVPSVTVAVLATAVLLLAAGCGKSNTEPNRTLVYSGSIKTDAPVVEILTLNGTGNVRFTVLDLQQKDATGAVVPNTAALAMGVGKVANICVASGNFVFAKGTNISLGLDEGNYCLRFFESGTLPAGNSLDYSMQAEVTD